MENKIIEFYPTGTIYETQLEKISVYDDYVVTVETIRNGLHYSLDINFNNILTSDNENIKLDIGTINRNISNFFWTLYDNLLLVCVGTYFVLYNIASGDDFGYTIKDIEEFDIIKPYVYEDNKLYCVGSYENDQYEYYFGNILIINDEGDVEYVFDDNINITEISSDYSGNIYALYFDTDMYYLYDVLNQMDIHSIKKDQYPLPIMSKFGVLFPKHEEDPEGDNMIWSYEDQLYTIVLLGDTGYDLYNSFIIGDTLWVRESEARHNIYIEFKRLKFSVKPSRKI